MNRGGLFGPRRSHRGPRVPVRNQMTTTECGAACLAMVLSAHGRDTTVSACREQLDVGRDGSSAEQIAQLARREGLRVRAFSLDLPALSELALPAILHWNFSHYVVLEGWRPGRYRIVDPGHGRRVLTEAEFSRAFTGIALELQPGEDFQRRRSRAAGSAVRFAAAFLGASRRLLARVIAVSLLLQLLVLLPALALKFTVDTVVAHQQVDLMAMFGLGLVLLLATNVLAGFARSVLLVRLHTQVDAGLMRRFFGHLLDLPYRYFQSRATGDLTMRLSSNSVVREVITGQTLSVIVDGMFIGVYAVVLVLTMPSYGLLVLALGSLQFATILASFRWMRDLVARDVLTQAEEQSYLVEALQGIETVKAAGAEERVYDRWSGLMHRQLAAAQRRRIADSGFESAFNVIKIGTPLVLLWFGTHQVLAGTLGLGTMLALNSLAGALLAPLGQLATATRQLQLVGSHLERIRDVLDEQVEQDRSAPLHRIDLRGRVELRGVSFRYGGTEALATDGVDLVVPAGAKVALVGRTGSGKSTLAKLILGLYRPTEGTVLHDGRDLTGLDLRALRGQCGVVVQDPGFFAASVRDNIAFGDPAVPMAAVIAAARKAQIHDEIMATPMGYHTPVAEGGSGFSGGQRQRLSLARALVRDPALLVLDEATSHLDVVTERAVDDVLSELSCTRVIVAHRLSTIRNADLIVVLDRGRVVERGTHDELLARQGAYAALVRNQLEQAPSQP
ncbi:peptidase domain-containing ABC transporter [Plantactinospora sp. CA-290183]|uniref:peptidase domain-containing ABC transporter n=1 Tax=Plantactinospora sp. CA-290183 TaxID=3240006 RepID=UPI003D8F760A